MTAEGQCRRVRPEDLASVAEIHLRAFPGSALSWLGLEAVRRYYEWQLTGPHEHEFVGVWREGNLVGYAVAGVSRGAMSGFVRQNAWYLACRVLTRPWLIIGKRFRGRLRLGLRSLMRGKQGPSPAPTPASGRSFGILAIAVDPAGQGQGLGKLLMSHLESVAVAKGFDRMHLTVAAGNVGAIAFYEGLGWPKRIREGRWDGLMEKPLAGARCLAGERTQSVTCPHE